MCCTEIEEVLIQWLEYRVVKQPGLGTEVGEDEGLRHTGLAGNGSSGRAGIATVFKFTGSRVDDPVDDLFARTARTRASSSRPGLTCGNGGQDRTPSRPVLAFGGLSSLSSH